MKWRQTSKKWTALLLSPVLAFTFTACQEDPDGSIVAHKDMDKLISQAAASEEGQVDAAALQADVAENFEAYQASLENEGLGVRAEVDARVEVPEVDKLSVYRVRQKEISQELVDQTAAELMPGETLYDGAILSARTRAEVESEIQYCRQEMEEQEARMRSGEDGDFTEEEIEGMKQGYQDSLDHLRQEYEKAPESFDLSAWPGDAKLKSTQEMISQRPDDGFVQWQAQLNADGEYCYAVTDGSDGLYKSLYVQNNKNYSNKLVYSCSPVAFPDIGGCLVSATYLGGDTNRGHISSGKDPETYWKDKGLQGVVINDYSVSDETAFEPVPGWSCELTREEAQGQAEAFLEKMGFGDFKWCQGEWCSEVLFLKGPQVSGPDSKLYFADYYVLQYYRDIDGVALSQSSGEKYQDGWDSEGNFSKQAWPGECIELRINDAGIVGFSLLSPLEITETVVEGAALKPFDEVKGTFESMLPMILGTEYEQRVAEIDQVRLSYSRISEKDSFDTGLVVPVWSFEGKYDRYAEGHFIGSWQGTQMAINAIDGSVINASLGY